VGLDGNETALVALRAPTLVLPATLDERVTTFVVNV
jgi:hypothetical protein